MEEQLQAAKNLLRRAADQANDQRRGEEAVARNRVQDREVTRGQLKGWRLFDSTEARTSKWLWVE
jgi:hypothetical protein